MQQKYTVGAGWYFTSGTTAYMLNNAGGTRSSVQLKTLSPGTDLGQIDTQQNKIVPATLATSIPKGTYTFYVQSTFATTPVNNIIQTETVTTPITSRTVN